jgi:diguanylate cyclase (GGDEF)-like protein/PAS domain S-box-containing protein
MTLATNPFEATPAPILIVGDDPAKLAALTAALAGLDVAIVTAGSGPEAVRRLLAREFAAVLLDVDPSGRDGFETATLIRGRLRAEHPPVLFTNIDPERLTDEAWFQDYEIGGVDYVLSPVLPQILRAKVAVFAELYRRRRQSRRQAEALRRTNETIARQSRELQADAARLKELQHIARLGSVEWRIPSGRWTCSAELEALFGIDAGYDRSAAGWAALLHPDDRGVIMGVLREAGRAEGGVVDEEFRVLSRGGPQELWVHLLAKQLCDAQGRPKKWLGTIQDITYRKQLELDYMQQAQQFRLLFEHNADGIIVVDRDGTIRLANPAAEKVFKRPRDRMVGTSFGVPVTVGCCEEITLAIDGMDQDIAMTSNEITWERQQCFLITLRDITAIKQREARVYYMALHDWLTQLPNLRLYQDRLSQAMARSARFGGYCAVVFLDLDNFKSLNDAHGHAIGDLLLVEVAVRLRSSLRQVDTVARFGGDEFVLLLSDLHKDPAVASLDACRVAEKIRAVLAEPYLLKVENGEQAETTIEHHCTASIGVTLFIDHENNPEDIMKRADVAMYRAKQAGGNSINFNYPTAD